jgi:hypothetical protein
MSVRRVPAPQRENLSAGSDSGEDRTMPGFHDRFDPMGLVIDWLDACRERRLSSLVDLYDESATLDCCCETARGRLDLEAYWRPKLAHAVIGAFEVDALFPETDGVCLDYRAFDGTPVRIHFRFTDEGKIRHIVCAPVKQAAQIIDAAVRVANVSDS